MVNIIFLISHILIFLRLTVSIGIPYTLWAAKYSHVQDEKFVLLFHLQKPNTIEITIHIPKSSTYFMD